MKTFAFMSKKPGSNTWTQTPTSPSSSSSSKDINSSISNNASSVRNSREDQNSNVSTSSTRFDDSVKNNASRSTDIVMNTGTNVNKESNATSFLTGNLSPAIMKRNQSLDDPSSSSASESVTVKVKTGSSNYISTSNNNSVASNNNGNKNTTNSNIQLMESLKENQSESSNSTLQQPNEYNEKGIKEEVSASGISVGGKEKIKIITTNISLATKKPISGDQDMTKKSLSYSSAKSGVKAIHATFNATFTKESPFKKLQSPSPPQKSSSSSSGRQQYGYHVGNSGNSNISLENTSISSTSVKKTRQKKRSLDDGDSTLGTPSSKRSSTDRDKDIRGGNFSSTHRVGGYETSIQSRGEYEHSSYRSGSSKKGKKRKEGKYKDKSERDGNESFQAPRRSLPTASSREQNRQNNANNSADITGHSSSSRYNTEKNSSKSGQYISGTRVKKSKKKHRQESSPNKKQTISTAEAAVQDMMKIVLEEDQYSALGSVVDTDTSDEENDENDHHDQYPTKLDRSMILSAMRRRLRLDGMRGSGSHNSLMLRRRGSSISGAMFDDGMTKGEGDVHNSLSHDGMVGGTSSSRGGNRRSKKKKKSRRNNSGSGRASTVDGGISYNATSSSDRVDFGGSDSAMVSISGVGSRRGDAGDGSDMHADFSGNVDDGNDRRSGDDKYSVTDEYNEDEGSIYGQTNGFNNATWVQCDKCRKWRRLRGVVDAKKLPSKWYCNMNKGDPDRASCSALEEDYAEGGGTVESATDQRTRKHLRLWVRRLKSNSAYEARQSIMTRGKRRSAVAGAKEPYQWIRCCNPSCGKWRSLLRCIDATSLIDNCKHGEWYCVLNTWDEKMASCAAPQENLPAFGCPDWVMQDEQDLKHA